MTNFKKTVVKLADGSLFEGQAPHWFTGSVCGEVVFTTGMVGYPESLIDPSYARQILVFTYPLIGNYGIPSLDALESNTVHPVGVVIAGISAVWDHSQGVVSLIQYLDELHVPYVIGVDTRALTRKIRSAGTMLGCITDGNPVHIPPMTESRAASAVHTEPLYFGIGRKTILLVDCGLKKSIVREMLQYDVRVKVVPSSCDYANELFDAVLISNGPGDPSEASEAIAVLRKAMRKKKPMMGICLGVQLMALAAGGKVYKLPYGHRGHNQPCVSTADGKGVMTSQNHGYAIDEKSLPRGWNVTYRNLNDGSIEGIAHESLPFFGVQFHPEAKPGPTDTKNFFHIFFQMIS